MRGPGETAPTAMANFRHSFCGGRDALMDKLAFLALIANTVFCILRLLNNMDNCDGIQRRILASAPSHSTSVFLFNSIFRSAAIADVFCAPRQLTSGPSSPSHG